MSKQSKPHPTKKVSSKGRSPTQTKEISPQNLGALGEGRREQEQKQSASL